MGPVATEDAYGLRTFRRRGQALPRRDVAGSNPVSRSTSSLPIRPLLARARPAHAGGLLRSGMERSRVALTLRAPPLM